jgi:hypothetical protein
MIPEWQGFADSLTQAFGAEFVEDFVKTLQDQKRAEEEIAFSSQRRIAAASERLEYAWMDGLGECHMRLDPEVYFHWVRKEGRACWNDKQFIAEFKRDNPETIVRSRSRKAMVVRP